MTERKGTTRRRRANGGDTVPRAMAEWFAGTPAVRRPLLFTLPHDCQVAAMWAIWSKDNPGTRPPTGWQWLSDPADSRHRFYQPALRALTRRLG